MLGKQKLIGVFMVFVVLGGGLLSGCGGTDKSGEITKGEALPIKTIQVKLSEHGEMALDLIEYMHKKNEKLNQKEGTKKLQPGKAKQISYHEDQMITMECCLNQTCKSVNCSQILMIVVDEDCGNGNCFERFYPFKRWVDPDDINLADFKTDITNYRLKIDADNRLQVSRIEVNNKDGETMGLFSEIEEGLYSFVSYNNQASIRSIQESLNIEFQTIYDPAISTKGEIKSNK